MAQWVEDACLSVQSCVRGSALRRSRGPWDTWNNGTLGLPVDMLLLQELDTRTSRGGLARRRLRMQGAGCCSQDSKQCRGDWSSGTLAAFGPLMWPLSEAAHSGDPLWETGVEPRWLLWRSPWPATYIRRIRRTHGSDSTELVREKDSNPYTFRHWNLNPACTTNFSPLETASHKNDLCELSRKGFEPLTRGQSLLLYQLSYRPLNSQTKHVLDVL